MRAKTTAVSDVGPYANEQIFVFGSNKEGGKVESVLEFVDGSLKGYEEKLRELTEEREEETADGRNFFCRDEFSFDAVVGTILM